MKIKFSLRISFKEAVMMEELKLQGL